METNPHWGHEPVVSFRIVCNPPHPSKELVDKFRNAFVPSISDAVGVLYTMDSGIRPLYQPMKRLCGPAVTVKMAPGDNMILFRALGMIQPGDVVVVDMRDHTETCGTGAGSLMLPISRGLAGIVTNGAWRDISELQAVDFPIYGRGISPYSGPKHRAGEINVPVCCGGVIVNPGDIVVCDGEGGAVVPLPYAEKVAAELGAYHLRESVEEWNLQRLEQSAKERDAFLEAEMKSKGGVYLDWKDR